MYQCSACKKAIGLMQTANGEPELFKCPNSGRVAGPVPPEPIRRKPIPRRADYEESLR